MKYIDIANELGREMSNSKEYIRLCEAEKNFKRDKEASELISKFKEKQKKLNLASQSNENINIIGNRAELSKLFTEIEENDIISELNTALKEFLIIKEKIYNEIEAYIKIKDEILSFNNNCGCSKGCGGCKK
ncbi:YlbF family regulator [Maledivibacter halophilus]|uniref:Cell fate regulator YlbF, YheA/YmcA/DUF963 family (Controls sporulation, competence, biofilm development) n=1 Tax=Maledivibacter halophilus TaxID=36842 RepID=A0A1T5LB33_9FIRM|nr:YlbF family regulator [Maledivibacter halophilus]SKC73180.1 Cell fate regulator YlbF, YheA/YmcA/DUF963 family (controls sporulation, competence, biofilm development) [Maledivibacter halophilus]